MTIIVLNDKKETHFFTHPKTWDWSTIFLDRNSLARSIPFQVYNWFEFSFPSPGMVAIPRVKCSVCPTIYLKLKGEYLDSYFFQGY